MVALPSESSISVDDALYNRGQGFYVPMLIHSRRLGADASTRKLESLLCLN